MSKFIKALINSQSSEKRNTVENRQCNYADNYYGDQACRRVSQSDAAAEQ